MRKTYFHFLSIISAIGIFILFIFFFNLSPEHPEVTRTMAVALLMAVLWITEVVPIAVTALIPVVLFPVLGIMDGRTTASFYFNNIIFLFLGGFIMALAMEKWNLHKRIALKIILFIGFEYRRLLLGFMLATAFLSMWISNTATVMMMTPIAMAVISKLEEKNKEGVKKFSIGLLLGIAYSASIGGIATLIGTPPNAIFVKILEINFPDIPEVSFSSWFIFAMPISVFLLALTWILLIFLYCPKKVSTIDKSIFLKEYKELGLMKYEEKVVAILFSLLAVMWLTRADIKFGSFIIHGWSSLLPYPKLIDDGTIAIGISILLFFIPSNKKEWTPIMDWETTRKLPWGIVLLFGGGFALAAGFKVSGLSVWICEKFSNLKFLPISLIVALICTGVAILTEFASNTASAQVVLPVMASLSKAINVNPFLTMVPATIAASCAFMLPVATPPNAIIFGTNRLSIWDMFKTGIFIDILAISIITIFSILWFK